METQHNQQNQRLLTDRDLEQLLGLARGTPSVWRSLGRHADLKPIKIGRLVRYRAEDVEAWLEAHRA